MPFGLGFFAAGGATGPSGPTFELINTQVLTTTATSISFNSIPADFRHLQIRSIARTNFSNASGLLQDIQLRMNSDTSNSYAAHRLATYGGGNQSASDGGSSNHIRINEGVAAGDTPSFIYSGCIIDILDYALTTKHKTTRALTGTHNPNEAAIVFQSGAWFNTGAITSLTLASAFGSYVAGSRFSLYGIRG